MTVNQYGTLIVKNPKFNLEVGTLQAFLDYYQKINPNAQVDYIHGEAAVTSLTASNPTNIGFYLPKMKKSDLFKTVILDGTLPRKTFSMGEPEKKRYYIEARQIN